MVPEYVSITTWCIWLQEFRCCREQVALEIAAKKPKIDAPSNGLTCCRRKLEGIFPTKLQSLESVNDWFQNLNQKQSAINFLLQIPNRQTEGKTGKTKRFTGDCRWLPVIAGDCRYIMVTSCCIMYHHVASLPMATMAHHGPSWPIMAHRRWPAISSPSALTDPRIAPRRMTKSSRGAARYSSGSMVSPCSRKNHMKPQLCPSNIGNMKGAPGIFSSKSRAPIYTRSWFKCFFYMAYTATKKMS